MLLGEITVTFGPKGEPSVPKGALIHMLLPLLDADPDLLSRMQSIRDWNGNVSLDAVRRNAHDQQNARGPMQRTPRLSQKACRSLELSRGQQRARVST